MKKLSVGVVICTFNGVKYLLEQLESILKQTYLPDHIVISDDGSTDGTWDFLESWVSKQPGIEVTIIRNEKQLGVLRNFEGAVSRITTDLIFCSDQDDIWFTDKVEVMIKVFEERKDVLLAHSDSLLIDMSGEALGLTLFDTLRLSKRERLAIHNGNAFDVLCRRNVVSGATLVFRRQLLQMAGPTPYNYYPDEWLAIIAAGMGTVELIDRPMIKYRQHESNMVGATKKGLIEELKQIWWDINSHRSLANLTESTIKKREVLYEHLAANGNVTERRLRVALDALEFSNTRKVLPKNVAWRFIKVLKNVFNKKYFRFSYAPRADIVRDIINK